MFLLRDKEEKEISNLILNHYNKPTMEYEIRYYFSEQMKENHKVAFTEHSNENKDKVIALANHRIIHSQFGFTCYEIIDLN